MTAFQPADLSRLNGGIQFLAAPSNPSGQEGSGVIARAAELHGFTLNPVAPPAGAPAPALAAPKTAENFLKPEVS